MSVMILWNYSFDFCLFPFPFWFILFLFYPIPHVWGTEDVGNVTPNPDSGSWRRSVSFNRITQNSRFLRLSSAQLSSDQVLTQSEPVPFIWSHDRHSQPECIPTSNCLTEKDYGNPWNLSPMSRCTLQSRTRLKNPCPAEITTACPILLLVESSGRHPHRGYQENMKTWKHHIRDRPRNKKRRWIYDLLHPGLGSSRLGLHPTWWALMPDRQSSG